MLLGSIVTYAIIYSPQPLINVFSEQYHISASTASLSISFSAISLAFGVLIVTMLSNAWGRKRIMSISLIITSLLAILSYLSYNFKLFLLIRLLEGLSAAGFPATAIAYLNEEISPSSTGSAIGVYVAGTAIGAFFGRVIIGALTDIVSWEFAFLILGIISLVCGIWFWRTLPDSKHFQEVPISFSNWILRFRNVLKKKLILLYIIAFLLMGIYVAMFNYIGYPLTQTPYNLSQTILGFLYVINLMGTVSSMYFGKLSTRYPRANLILIAAALLLAGTLLTLNGNLYVKIFALAVFVFGFFAGHTVTNGWVGVVAPSGKKAEAASLYLLFFYIGSGIIGWGGGFFWTHLGWGGFICMLCILIVLCAFLAFLVKH
ncbi:MFS transporter [Desulfosporosinus sp. Sb-LF]|uniref:MFS transporter n=1 Tax=Desulfosporosinus sp. Sb-LF TaxID=2560027 RepID=UPI001FB16DA7|nr:MFS transporter [Desulfosporosinus sp. Sb-LF]